MGLVVPRAPFLKFLEITTAPHILRYPSPKQIVSQLYKACPVALGDYFWLSQGGLKLESLENHLPWIIFVSIKYMIYLTEDNKRKSYPNKQNRYIDVQYKCQCSIIIMSVFGFLLLFRGSQTPTATLHKGGLIPQAPRISGSFVSQLLSFSLIRGIFMRTSNCAYNIG